MMPDQNIYLLTGPVQTGKTTSLINWTKKKNDVFGILTPVVDGKRMFRDAHTQEQFSMEAATGEKEILTVGRFIFSKTNFDKAIQILRDAMQSKKWLVIDEIGPLELRGEGFCTILKGILQNRGEEQIILLVVREGLAEKVKEYFDIKGTLIVNDISALPV
jgi:nucleoside-triphosphatase THEP1